MPALPNRQHRLAKNARNLAAKDAHRYQVYNCPVCGRRRRMAQTNGEPEAGCSTECNDILLKERKAKARRAKSLRFLEWRKMMQGITA